MNIHKNARTTPQSRALLVHRVVREGWPVSAVAVAFGISERTVYKWLRRYRAEGLSGLGDRSSVARRCPHALAPAWLARFGCCVTPSWWPLKLPSACRSLAPR
jgi:transposase